MQSYGKYLLSILFIGKILVYYTNLLLPYNKVFEFFLLLFGKNCKIQVVEEGTYTIV